MQERDDFKGLIHVYSTKYNDWYNSFVWISGAIFNDDQKGNSVELAFKYAVYRINKDANLLPNTTLVYEIQYVPKKDSFHAGKKGK